MKLVYLVGFNTKKFVTMHCHMNVIYQGCLCGPEPLGIHSTFGLFPCSWRHTRIRTPT